MNKIKEKKVNLACYVYLSSSPAGLLQQKEVKVLFVGNSYTYGYNLAHVVAIMSEETSAKLITRKSVIGGLVLWNTRWAVVNLRPKKSLLKEILIL